MSQNLLIVVGGVIGVLLSVIFSLFRSRKNEENVTISKQNELDARRKSDQAVKDYLDALKKYDPDFNGDDDTGGHSA